MTPASFPVTPGARSGWTDERIRRLETLWVAGRSASEAAAALGVSRNAVIGKVHRLGLSRDGRHAAARPRPAKVAVPKAPKRVRRGPAHPPRPAAVEVDTLEGLVARLEDLPPRACHWPVGDPRAAGFAFCGRRADGGPYCAVHHRIGHLGDGRAEARV